eukprot:355623-Chlamydomonas_euryale.AAC.2
MKHNFANLCRGTKACEASRGNGTPAQKGRERRAFRVPGRWQQHPWRTASDPLAVRVAAATLSYVMMPAALATERDMHALPTPALPALAPPPVRWSACWASSCRSTRRRRCCCRQPSACACCTI